MVECKEAICKEEHGIGRRHVARSSCSGLLASRPRGARLFAVANYCSHLLLSDAVYANLGYEVYSFLDHSEETVDLVMDGAGEQQPGEPDAKGDPALLI